MTDSARPPAGELGNDATAEAARRGREVLTRQVATMLGYAAGASLLCLRPWTWSSEFWLGAGCFVLALEREARAGRRWLADPPGPPRD
ncbi:hypothetical protein [Blastococcus sp. SYSU D01042]